MGHRMSLGTRLLAVVACMVAVAGCGSTPRPTSKPTEAVVVQLSGFRVKDDAAQAWATLTAPDAFALLSTGGFQSPTISDWAVTTDAGGQAQLCPGQHVNASTQTCADVACRVYVYEDSVFGAYPCPESAAGTTGCSIMGTQALANCHLTLETLSATVTGLGTWFSLLYLWDPQMTLVIAGDGSIEVTPVVELVVEGDLPPLGQMDPLERARVARQLGVRERVPGASKTVEIQDGRAQFLFTAPDAKLEELGLDPDLLDRTWHSMDRLPVLVDQLRLVEPRLVPWLERVWEQARRDDVDVGGGAVIIPRDQLAVTTFGEEWQSQSLQESIVYAVNWAVLDKEFFAEPLPVQVIRQEPDGSLTPIRYDAREAGYDPERAKALLEEGGYADGLLLVLQVPREDAFFGAAQLIAEQMAEVGVEVRLEVLGELGAGPLTRAPDRRPGPVFTLARQ